MKNKLEEPEELEKLEKINMEENNIILNTGGYYVWTNWT